MARSISCAWGICVLVSSVVTSPPSTPCGKVRVASGSLLPVKWDKAANWATLEVRAISH